MAQPESKTERKKWRREAIEFTSTWNKERSQRRKRKPERTKITDGNGKTTFVRRKVV